MSSFNSLHGLCFICFLTLRAFNVTRKKEKRKKKEKGKNKPTCNIMLGMQHFQNAIGPVKYFCVKICQVSLGVMHSVSSLEIPYPFTVLKAVCSYSLYLYLGNTGFQEKHRRRWMSEMPGTCREIQSSRPSTSLLKFVKSSSSLETMRAWLIREIWSVHFGSW